MNCLYKSDEALLDYTAGRMNADKMAALDLHMQTCPDCAALRFEQTAVWDALDAWEPAPVSVDFNRRLWQRIDAADAAPWYQRLADSFRFGNWKPAFALTAAMVVIAAGFILDHPAELRQATSAEGVSTTEAEQVEQTLDDLQLLHQFDSVTAAVPKQM
jgi:anti-sigma factor RsiW